MMRLRVDTEQEFTIKVVDMLQLCMHPKELEKRRLTKGDKEFYADMVYLHNRGIDISTKKAIEILTTEFGYASESYVYKMRTKLKKRGWLKPTKIGFEFPGHFEINPKEPTSRDFRMILEYKGNEGIKEADQETSREVLAGQQHES